MGFPLILARKVFFLHLKTRLYIFMTLIMSEPPINCPWSFHLSICLEVGEPSIHNQSEANLDAKLEQERIKYQIDIQKSNFINNISSYQRNLSNPKNTRSPCVLSPQCRILADSVCKYRCSSVVFRAHSQKSKVQSINYKIVGDLAGGWPVALAVGVRDM